MGKTCLPTLEALEGEGLEARKLGSSSVPLHHPDPSGVRTGLESRGRPPFLHTLSEHPSCWVLAEPVKGHLSFYYFFI